MSTVDRRDKERDGSAFDEKLESEDLLGIVDVVLANMNEVKETQDHLLLAKAK